MPDGPYWMFWIVAGATAFNVFTLLVNAILLSVSLSLWKSALTFIVKRDKDMDNHYVNKTITE